MQLELDSAYGDGWYDGFIHARQIAMNSENDSNVWKTIQMMML